MTHQQKLRTLNWEKENQEIKVFVVPGKPSYSLGKVDFPW